ncbi:Fc receptor-like protein 3 isoform X2 [Cavia porcellus]|uniref:Fc receptor-like protein 3 isoform X2 n=1 Tax=Cavia porcellus TaxID=10141 RepID=UPI002FE3027D
MSCPELFRILMHLWLLLLLLGVPPKAVLELDPPWSTAFKGEIVTVRCMDFNSLTKRPTTWWQNGKVLKKVSEIIQIKSSGDYQCKTPGSSLSDPVHVEFSSGWLILQAKHPIYEGDSVTLKCLGKKEKSIIQRDYYKDEEKIFGGSNLQQIIINSVFMDPGEYKCTASGKLIIPWTETSNSLRIQFQELFPHPVLTARPSQPIEGGPVTLTCETQLSPWKPDVQLQFCFFRDVQTLGSGCSSSPKLQIPIMWNEDSGSYWCQAATTRITKKSQRSQIHVQRIPVSHVNLEIQPLEGQLIEGHKLVLICSVAKGTGNITFSWHRDGRGILGIKTQHSQLAELQLPTVTERDAGRYYCTADNNNGPILSKKISVTVKIPISNPVLTIRAPRALAVVGDLVWLYCEVQRGSPPILYQFYHENVTVGSGSAPSGGGAFFNFSLTVEHSGKYSCEADNGLGSQHSHPVSLKVTVPVSCPVFTFRSSQGQAVIGDTVELHCESLRGSPPILYRFYRENVTLGNSSAPWGGGASFNLLVNTEHAGNYSCEADNGLGAQRSEVVTFSVIGISRSRVGAATAGVTGLLLGLVITAVLLYCFGTRRKSGGTSAMGMPSYNPCVHQEPSSSRPPPSNPEEPICSEPLAVLDLQPVYSNVNPENTNLIYSQIQNIQHTNGNLANSPRVHREDTGPVVIYSELKKSHGNDFAKHTSKRESIHEDATGNYENV